MPNRTVRARLLDDGHFEFTEPVRIPGREFDVTINEPAELAPARKPYVLPAEDLGPMTHRLTREEIYGDLLR